MIRFHCFKAWRCIDANISVNNPRNNLNEFLKYCNKKYSITTGQHNLLQLIWSKLKFNKTKGFRTLLCALQFKKVQTSCSDITRTRLKYIHLAGLRISINRTRVFSWVELNCAKRDTWLHFFGKIWEKQIIYLQRSISFRNLTNKF